MPIENPPQAGAVLYAKNVERLVSFYSSVAGLQVRSTQQDHGASSIEIANPPVRRENTPIKLVFFVQLREARRNA